jgi:hypothetical protein
MRAELKDIDSPDIDLKNYEPNVPNNFCFLLELMIGLEGEDKSDIFSISVCTPDWLNTYYNENDIIIGKHLLIVFNYNLDKIKEKISKYCERCVGDSWEEIVIKLKEIASWEFDNYQ